jgi:ABC-type branched-subunit amino acid transport system substrate-binding protein
MKRFGFLLTVALLISPGPPVAGGKDDGAGDEKPKADAPAAAAEIEIDEYTREILRKLDAAGPYEVPDLGVRKDENYGYTPADVEPFGAVRPFMEHFLVQMEYTGPGRAIPEPEQVDTVKLGFIGPIMSTVSVATGGKSHEEALGIQMLQGTRLAIEDANARGGYLRRRIPFELVVRNDNGLWGASGNEIITMAYKDRVWAILGTIDGANSHIAIRVALKAEIFMINTGDTDPTFIETNIPWVARVIGDDRQQGYLLTDYLYRKNDFERIGIIRASNRYGRFGVREILDSSRRLGHPVALEMAYEVGGDDFSLQLERLRNTGVDAIVHWGDARDGATILNQMREMGMAQPFFGCGRTVSDEFVAIAGPNAEGVIASYPWNPHRDDEALASFRGRFRERFGVKPDTYAAHAYDGMNMLIWSVQVAGLNRARIRDLIAYRVQPWPGVTGDIPLSATLDDVGEVYLANFANGGWNFRSRDDLEMPRGFIPQRDRVSRNLERAAPGPAAEAGPHALRDNQYHGPGKDDPEPEALDEVRIGWFGPDDPDHPIGGDPWVAANLAVEAANAVGGYLSLPFRLVPAWSENPWGTGIADLARQVYEGGVWAIVGSVDGASTHLAEQVVTKARLPLISPVATDTTVNLAGVGWAYSCMPSDDRQAEILVGILLDRIGSAPFVLVSGTDHDSRAAAAAFKKHLRPAGRGPSLQLELEPAAGVDPIIEAIGFSGTEAIVVLAGPADSARMVRALRDRGFGAPIFGGAAMESRAFLAAAGDAAEGVVFPLGCDPAAFETEFARRFRDRTGHLPDCAAIQTFDALDLLIEAIQDSGLNRARIRDAVEAISPWNGYAGQVRWDRLGRNERAVIAATVHQGRVVAADVDPGASPVAEAIPRR